MDLSPTDRRLIAALRDNSRASITELAQIVKASRTTVKSRVDALVAAGRIRRFTIETDTDIESEIRAITMIGLKGGVSRSAIRTLRLIPEVSAIHSTNGVWDLVVMLNADSLHDFDRALHEIREVPGVQTSETSLLLNPVS